jgi:hypothetical protein
VTGNERKFQVAMQLREREVILRVLVEEVSGWIDATALRYAVNQLGVPIPERPFKLHMEYLTDRGYIRTEERRFGSLCNTLVHVTAKGQDLHGGLIEDPGVGAGDGGRISG